MGIEIRKVSGNTYVYRIKFSEFVSWKNGADGLVQIQDLFDENLCKKIIMDLNDTFYIDALLLTQFFLYLDKAYDMGVEMDVELLDRDNREHMRFLKYLMDGGFINILDKYIPDIKCQVKKKIDCYDINELWYGNFESQEVVFPLQVIHSENEIDDVIKEVNSSLLRMNLDTDNISLKMNLFLQETMENVFEHAYDKNEKKYCALLIVRKSRHKDKKSGRREYFLPNDKVKTFDYDTYNNFMIKENPYLIKDFNGIRADYLQVYILDIGRGILRGLMDVYNPRNDRKLLNEVFMHSNRTNRRKKNTKAGGLYMINNVLSASADGLGMRSEYSWFPFECAKDEELLIKGNNYFVFSEGYEKKTLLRGFSIVGYLNIFGKITKEYSSYFKTADTENVINIYKMHDKIGMCSKNVKMLDFRFDYNMETNSIVEENNIIIFPSRDMRKNRLIRILNKITECGKRYENIIIADIYGYELSKYFLIFSGIKIAADCVYLISRNYILTAFVPDLGGCMKYSEEKVMNYLKYNSENMDVCNNIYGYINCLIKYESALFWNALERFQKKTNQKIVIDEPIKWNFASNKNMTTYMDFSQSTFIRECKEILLNQMYRLAYIHGKKVYFVSVERFTKDICDLANAGLGNNQDNMCIYIGSTYVTGTASLKQTILDKKPDNKWFYFFTHPDSEGEIEISTMLEWRKDIKPKDTKQDSKIKYERLESTSFISQGGIDFFRKMHYQNESNRVINMPSDKMYAYLQEYNTWSDIIFSIGHVDLDGPHDLMIFNIIKMFEKDRLESYTQPRLLDTSYDYLLCNFYVALVGKKEITKKIIEEDLSNNLFSKSSSYEKIKSYYKKYRENINGKNGLLLYFTDYTTIRIISYFQKIFGDELNNRIMPLSLVNPKKGAASLLLSPLLADGLKTIIQEMKEDKKECPKVTIFTSMIISTRLLNELRHVLYCLGANVVEVITFIDRQRLPFGYSQNDNILPFWKMEIPPLGNRHNCILCNGIAQITNFKEYLMLDQMINRISEIESRWRSQKLLANKFSIITSKKIELPEEINEIICDFKGKYLALENLEITTDIGLALFSIESMAITQSTNFLDNLLKFIEDKNVKTILLCAHLGLFRKEDINERKNLEWVGKLYDCLADQEVISDYSGLALIVIVAQNTETISELKEKAEQNLVDGRLKNMDALLCTLFILHWCEDKPNVDINYYFKNCKTILEIVNSIFQYTYHGCSNSHSGILIRMYERAVTMTEERYLDALGLLYYLKEVYSNLPKDIIDSEQENIEICKSLDTIISEQITLLEKLEGKVSEEYSKQLFEGNDKLIRQAEKINKKLFRSSRDRSSLRKDIEDIRLECEYAIKEDELRKKIKNIVIEIPEVEEENDYWYCITKDMKKEISYLIQDFRYLKKTMLWTERMTGEQKQPTGVIFPKFKKEFLEIHFYNSVSSDFDLNKYIQTKRIKESRPSIIRMKMMFLGERPVDIFQYKKNDVGDNESVLDACLRIPYIYVRNK